MVKTSLVEQNRKQVFVRKKKIFVPKPDTLFSALIFYFGRVDKNIKQKKTQQNQLREYFVFAFLSESEIEFFFLKEMGMLKQLTKLV